MGTDIEKLVDLMIQERMQSQFAKVAGGRNRQGEKSGLPSFGNRV